MADVAQIRSKPQLGILTSGEAVQLAADARDSLGKPMVNRVVTWTTSHREVADVGPDGLVQARGPGEARISAQSARVLLWWCRG